MHLETHLPRTKKPRTIPIEVLRLDFELALADPVIDDVTGKRTLNPIAKRIREINAALGDAMHYPAKDAPEAGGTKLTTIRVEQNPIATLLAKRKIGGEEFMAAQDIELAIMAIAGASMFKPLTMEKSDRSHMAADWPRKTCDAVARYRTFANHWSARKKQSGDPMLSIVYSAVVDQWTMRTIGSDLGYHHSKIERAVICGLRDYAGRAGWLERRVADRAAVDAADIFKNLRAAG